MFFHRWLACETVPTCFRNDPGSTKLSSRWSSRRLSKLILAPLDAILSPTWSILGPRWAPRGIQFGSRRRALRKFCEWRAGAIAENFSRGWRIFLRRRLYVNYNVFCMISKNSFCKRGRNLLLRWRQDGAKEALRWLEEGSSWPYLGSSWCSLAPCWLTCAGAKMLQHSLT